MASTGKKWALGCGIGCGVALLIGAMIVGGGIFAGRRIADRADSIDESFEQVQAEYGDAADFVPPLDGRIAADRLEIFLAVRDAMSGTRERLADDFLILDGEKGGGLDKIKAGIRFLPSLFDFIEDRNRVLMDQGMGLGEYQYIYSLAYYGLLRRDPADGPGFTMVSDDEDEDDSGWRFEAGVGSEDEDEIRKRRAREVRRVVNEFQTEVTANQLSALASDFGDLGDLDREAWTAQLSAEAGSLEEEHLKLLWEDGLPDHVRASLDPFRSRLEESYDPMTSILEMGLINHD